MKFEIIDDCKIVVYYSLILDDLNTYDTNDIKTFIKYLVVKLRNTYNLDLHGYYHLDVYINKIIILEFVLIDEYEDEIDLNIKIHFNSDIMVKFDDYFLIDCKKYFYNDNYYASISDIDLTKCIEFVDFIYKDEAKKVKNNGILINL